MINIPITSFPISGVLYDETATALASTIVYAYNQTNNEYTSSTTNSSGEFTLDLANMSTQWVVGDRIWVYSVKEGNNAVMTAKITTGDSFWENDLYMKNGELLIDVSSNSVKQSWSVVSAIASCTSAKSVVFVEKKSGQQRFLLNVAANSTTSVHFGKAGIPMQDGFWVLPMTQGQNLNNQSSGVSNSRGDIATNITNIIAYYCY